MTATGRQSGNLPVPVTRFVGRRAELTELRRQLQESRLVTLTGVGGVGKTRLAIEAGHALRRAFPGGVWMVDLSAVTEAGQVPQAVANALAVADRSTRSPVDQVIAHLQDSVALLVLDNCEHLIGACARFVEGLLARATGVRVLATSRQTLGIAGERLLAVPPLAVPDARGMATALSLAQYDAVMLLVDRASALQPGFAITEQNRVAAARLCAQLDGLPLAIELAATRLRALSLESLVDRFEGRFALLAGGGRAAQPRQQTLRAVMDWSHSLCSEPERVLWARLSVFAGSFDLEAAEGVCADERLPAGMILDLVDRLVAQSIVLAEHDGPLVRFRLLETIRQYGRTRLAELGEEEVLRHRHRDFYLQLAESVAAAWCSSRQQAGLATLRAEHDNLRAALEAAVADPAGPSTALRLVSALRQHWYADAFLGEGRVWLDRALAVPVAAGDRSASTAARVEALWVAAWVSLLQGDAAAAWDRLDEGGRLARELGDERAAGYVASLRGTGELFAGDPEAGRARFEQAQAVFDRIGETEGALWTMFQLAISLSHRAQGERAQAICRQALAISAAAGEQLCRSYTLWVLGFDTWLNGGPDDPAGLAREGLAIQQGFNDPVGVALIIELLAWIAADKGEPAQAARLLAVAESVWSLIGTRLAAFGPHLLRHRERCEQQVAQALGAAGLPAERDRQRYQTVAEAIAAALARDPGTGRSPVGAAAAGGVGGPTGPLSAREEQIAALLAQGLSNRAIAGQLVISQRTVDGHVERILAKLGFSARAQVAAWVAARAADTPGPPGTRPAGLPGTRRSGLPGTRAAGNG